MAWLWVLSLVSPSEFLGRSWENMAQEQPQNELVIRIQPNEAIYYKATGPATAGVPRASPRRSRESITQKKGQSK